MPIVVVTPPAGETPPVGYAPWPHGDAHVILEPASRQGHLACRADEAHKPPDSSRSREHLDAYLRLSVPVSDKLGILLVEPPELRQLFHVALPLT